MDKMLDTIHARCVSRLSDQEFAIVSSRCTNEEHFPKFRQDEMHQLTCSVPVVQDPEVVPKEFEMSNEWYERTAAYTINYKNNRLVTIKILPTGQRRFRLQCGGENRERPTTTQ